jgi:CTP:molybdopterin cytidylyltransferase MocA
MPGAAITGVILAGGLGRRMGGVDKGMQLLDGRPLAAHVADRLAPQVDRLLINANRSQAAYAALGYPVFADEIPDFAGPLAGLHAALAASQTSLVVTAPCDSPFLPADLVGRLRGAARRGRQHRPRPGRRPAASRACAELARPARCPPTAGAGSPSVRRWAPSKSISTTSRRLPELQPCGTAATPTEREFGLCKSQYAAPISA